ncbi:23S rRNA (guanosine(2251)-2'-O)-methyltransferase RlmB [Xylocopilactobacillus apicola]|uniref:23S rRNA (Guanosine(2251)-2'-O)-methyltransferase RlmB n=1 Tax=Xylocopilactobacillus apicola TaxID=2932184 RepID=A0AAU9DP40_9LACO|nr:23S rRNA (guanosine(2251)-2'-O)-methyltransferase RlmB [Xylocopilactobacillus apicola]BDR58887.1 23S rRNA (guanosine(2251)-2'-O)-methyltransferase RlmB [Xylocopilactobacillus apicola]
MQNSEEHPNQIYGRHAVLNALKQLPANQINQLLIQKSLKNSYLSDLTKLAKAKKIIVKIVPKDKLDKLANGGVHQGVVLEGAPFVYSDLSVLKDSKFLLMLDNIMDPHNFGSLIRSADAAGVDAIIIPERRNVQVTDTVWKSSTGAASFVPIVRVVNLSATIKSLKEEGFWFFGADMQGTNWLDWQVNGKICLIIGNEGSGISPGVRDKIDEFIKIPMFGHVDSLNASVAGGSLLLMAATKRH